MNLTHSSDRAVSPVVATILMVGITVILAAAAGTYFMGIGSDQNTARAGISAENTTDGYNLEVVDMGNTHQLNATCGSNTITIEQVGTHEIEGPCDEIQIIGSTDPDKERDDQVITNIDTTTLSPPGDD